jgi:hypothetical protein
MLTAPGLGPRLAVMAVAERKSVLKLKTEGDKLTGTINGRQEDIKITDGKVTGDEVSASKSAALVKMETPSRRNTLAK